MPVVNCLRIVQCPHQDLGELKNNQKIIVESVNRLVKGWLVEGGWLKDGWLKDGWLKVVG